MPSDLRTHLACARAALKARRGEIAVSELGRSAAQMYGHLTERELEEMAQLRSGN